MKKYNVAIVGIRGAVGQEMLEILKERNFPIDELRPMSLNPDECPDVEYDGRKFAVVKLSHDAFKGIDIALSSPGAKISAEYTPSAVKAGAVVIDNTSHFRMEPDVPLVVPEVNPEDVKNHKGIIANPNCSTIQMVLVLKPLHDFGKIRRVIVSTYQSVSGAGRACISELEEQEEAHIEQKPINVKEFQHQIFRNIIPHIDAPQENLYTKEEMKMVNETQKIMHDDSIKVTATCVRVPVIRAHCESVNIETEKKIDYNKAIELLTGAPGVVVIDDLHNERYPLPLHAEGKDDTFIGRIREDETIENGLNLWVVSDNLRKGAALNAIQIAEELIKQELI